MSSARVLCCLLDEFRWWTENVNSNLFGGKLFEGNWWLLWGYFDEFSPPLANVNVVSQSQQEKEFSLKFSKRWKSIKQTEKTQIFLSCRHNKFYLVHIIRRLLLIIITSNGDENGNKMRSTFAWYADCRVAKVEIVVERWKHFPRLFFVSLSHRTFNNRTVDVRVLTLSRFQKKDSNVARVSEIRISFSIFLLFFFVSFDFSLPRFCNDLCAHGLRLCAAAASELWMIGSDIGDIAEVRQSSAFFLCCQLSSSSTLFERFISTSLTRFLSRMEIILFYEF